MQCNALTIIAIIINIIIITIIAIIINIIAIILDSSTFQIRGQSTTIILCIRPFHSVNPTGWAESISGIGLCGYVAMSVITSKMIIISAHRLHRPL